MKLFLLIFAFFSVQLMFQAQAQQAYLHYEDLLDCVEISLEMDELRSGIVEIGKLEKGNLSSEVRKEVSAAKTEMLTSFNQKVPVFNGRCSRASYVQDELASICTQSRYETSTFCTMMAW